MNNHQRTHASTSTMFAILLATFTASAAIEGCASEEDGGAQSCLPGAEACPCDVGGLCAIGLVCASGVCVDLGADSGDDDDDGDGGAVPKDPDLPDGGDGDGDPGGEYGSCVGSCGGLANGGDLFCTCFSDCEEFSDCCPDYALACGGSGGCAVNSDCGPSEVCRVTGDCVDALATEYSLYVYWEDHTPDCFDSGLESGCLADVYMETTFGGQSVATSSVQTDATTAWFEPVVLTPDGVKGLTMAFYDFDEFSGDDYLFAICVGAGSCGPLSVVDLHNGSVTWDFSGDDDPKKRFYAEAIFIPE